MLENAMKIVKNSNSFYYKDETIDGNKFRIFNYRLISYSDFKNEGAEELRGLTVNLENGEYFLSIHKFFNHEENQFVMDSLSNDLEIIEKLDGSLIQPILLNSKIIVKTKGTFSSIQAQEAQKLLNKNRELYNLTLDLLKNGFIPLFEYISPNNQIVVQYPQSELKIIQVRNNKTGEYIPYRDLQKDKVISKYLPQVFYYSFEELLELQEKQENIEGYVVRDLQKSKNIEAFRKIKTRWYLTLHHLISPNVLRENDILLHILDETIDDILSNVNQEKKLQIQEIQRVFDDFYNNELKTIEKLIRERYERNRKEFALEHKTYPYFGVVMKADLNNFEEKFKEFLKKKIQKYKKAKEFLYSLKGGRNDPEKFIS